MEIILVPKGRTEETGIIMTLPDIEPVSSDWLAALCEKVFTQAVSIHYRPKDMLYPYCPERK